MGRTVVGPRTTLPDFELVSVAPLRLIPDMSTPLKSLFDKLTDGPTMYPFDSWYFTLSGMVVVVKIVSVDPETFPDDVFVKMALVKTLPVISAPPKLPFVKLYPIMFNRGPIMYPAVTLYPRVMALGVPYTCLDVMFVNTAFVRFAPLTSIDETNTPVKLAPLKSTPGPTMYPFKKVYPYAKLFPELDSGGSPNTMGFESIISIPPDRIFVNTAFVKSDPLKNVLLTSSPVRFLPDIFTPGPNMYVPRIVYFAGRRAIVVALYRIFPPLCTFVKIVLVKVAFVMSVFVK